MVMKIVFFAILLRVKNGRLSECWWPNSGDSRATSQIFKDLFRVRVILIARVAKYCNYILIFQRQRVTPTGIFFPPGN